MHRPALILDPAHGGHPRAFYDLDNGVRLSDTWDQVRRLPESRKTYFSKHDYRRWKLGERADEPRFYFARNGRRVTWGDPGCRSPFDPGLEEKDLTLDVSRTLHRKLHRQLSVKTTRDRDGYVSSARRASFANRVATNLGSPAVFLSLHADLAPDPRHHGFRLHPNPRAPKRLVATLLRSLRQYLEELGQEGFAGEVEAGHPDLNAVDPPGVALVLGWLSSPEDTRRLLDRHLRQELASVLAEGLLGYFRGAAPEIERTPTPEAPGDSSSAVSEVRM